MDARFIPIADFGLPETSLLLTQAFSDYFVKIAFTEAALQQTARVDSVDFSLSPVVQLDGVPVAVGLVARRGTVSRLAGMAVVPAARRRGVGRILMERLLADARRRSDRRMGLEVIEQNTAAVRLYEAMGFVRWRRLVGFAGPAPAESGPAPDLKEASLADVAAAVARLDGEVDWPWQISAETITLLPPTVCGYALDGAWVALQNPAGPTVGIRALAVDGAEHRGDRAARLLRAVMARHPAKEWRISALWPEEFSAWFTPTGLIRQALTQWQMVRELEARAPEFWP